MPTNIVTSVYNLKKIERYIESVSNRKGENIRYQNSSKKVAQKNCSIAILCIREMQLNIK